MIELIRARPVLPPFLQGLPTFRVARKGGLALGIKMAGAWAALGLQITLARLLGHAEYGDYAYAFAWLQLMVIFAPGGFSTAALRYVAEYRACRQHGLVRGFLQRAAQIALLESVVLALLMAGFATAILGADSGKPLHNFLIASSALPIHSQFLLYTNMLRGLGRVISGLLVGLAHPLLFLAALLAATSGFGVQFSSSGALALNLAVVMCCLAMILALRQRCGRSLNLAEPEFRTGEWFGTATQMMFVSSLVFLQGRTGVIISGLLLDSRAAGVYAAMERLPEVACLGLASVNVLIAPTFAAMHAQGRQQDLQWYARLAAWAATGFMVLTVIPLIFFGKPLLRLFGEEFVAGYPALLVLLGGAAVNAMCGSVGILLNMTGHHRRLFKSLLAGLAANLLLSFLLIPRYGILGTAWANAIAMALWNIGTLYAVRVHLGIWPNVGRLTSNRIV